MLETRGDYARAKRTIGAKKDYAENGYLPAMLCTTFDAMQDALLAILQEEPYLFEQLKVKTLPDWVVGRHDILYAPGASCGCAGCKETYGVNLVGYMKRLRSKVRYQLRKMI